MDLKDELPEGLVIPQRQLSCDPEEQLLQQRRRDQIENNGFESETLDRKWYNVTSSSLNNNMSNSSNNSSSKKKTQIPPFSLSSTLGYK